MKPPILTALLAAATLAAGAAQAQVTFPGGPRALAAELVHRTETGGYPMFGYDVAEIREGAARIHSKDPDDWCALWSAFAARHMARGRAAEQAGDKAAAQREYDAAFNWYSLARWPAPQTAARRVAYQRSLEAFEAYDRLNDPPLQHLSFQFRGETVRAWLRTPKGKGPFPLYIQIGGLDGYKELLARGQSVSFAQAGIATLMLDAPGTGEGVKITPEAWRSLQTVIEGVTARPDIDRRRVVLWGGSFGGYWATVLAYRMPEAFQGVVAHGVQLSLAEMGEKPGSEYMFDEQVALTTTVEGARDWKQARRMFLAVDKANAGLLAGHSPPMLLLNGAKDTLEPIGNLYRLLSSGEDAKEAWVNPQGMHLGRQGKVWTFGRINQDVTLPWVYRRLGATPPAATRSDIP